MMKKLDKKPFWVSDTEMEGLKGTPQDNLSEILADSIPQLTEIVNSQVAGKYGFKDGVLIYHIHHPVRKKIFDKAHSDMDQLSVNEKDIAVVRRGQAEIAQTANTALDAAPWWPGVEQVLVDVFTEVFKYIEHKVSFYPEVDAWSVILPENAFPLQPGKDLLKRPFVKIAERVMG